MLREREAQQPQNSNAGHAVRGRKNPNWEGEERGVREEDVCVIGKCVLGGGKYKIK